MTEVYMPWEAILKIGMNGVNSSDDEMEIITNYTSVAHTTSYEKDEWYPLPGKGRKASMVISKEDLLEIKFKLTRKYLHISRLNANFAQFLRARCVLLYSNCCVSAGNMRA